VLQGQGQLILCEVKVFGADASPAIAEAEEKMKKVKEIASKDAEEKETKLAQSIKVGFVSLSAVVSISRLKLIPLETTEQSMARRLLGGGVATQKTMEMKKKEREMVTKKEMAVLAINQAAQAHEEKNVKVEVASSYKRAEEEAEEKAEDAQEATNEADRKKKFAMDVSDKIAEFQLGLVNEIPLINGKSAVIFAQSRQQHSQNGTHQNLCPEDPCGSTPTRSVFLNAIMARISERLISQLGQLRFELVVQLIKDQKEIVQKAEIRIAAEEKEKVAKTALRRIAVHEATAAQIETDKVAFKKELSGKIEALKVVEEKREKEHDKIIADQNEALHEGVVKEAAATEAALKAYNLNGEAHKKAADKEDVEKQSARKAVLQAAADHKEVTDKEAAAAEAARHSAAAKKIATEVAAKEGTVKVSADKAVDTKDAARKAVADKEAAQTAAAAKEKSEKAARNAAAKEKSIEALDKKRKAEAAAKAAAKEARKAAAAVQDHKKKAP